MCSCFQFVYSIYIIVMNMEWLWVIKCSLSLHGRSAQSLNGNRIISLRQLIWEFETSIKSCTTACIFIPNSQSDKSWSSRCVMTEKVHARKFRRTLRQHKFLLTVLIRWVLFKKLRSVKDGNWNTWTVDQIDSALRLTIICIMVALKFCMEFQNCLL